MDKLESFLIRISGGLSDERELEEAGCGVKIIQNLAEEKINNVQDAIANFKLGVGFKGNQRIGIIKHGFGYIIVDKRQADKAVVYGVGYNNKEIGDNIIKIPGEINDLTIGAAELRAFPDITEIDNERMKSAFVLFSRHTDYKKHIGKVIGKLDHLNNELAEIENVEHTRGHCSRSKFRWLGGTTLFLILVVITLMFIQNTKPCPEKQDDEPTMLHNIFNWFAGISVSGVMLAGTYCTTFSYGRRKELNKLLNNLNNDVTIFAKDYLGLTSQQMGSLQSKVNEFKAKMSTQAHMAAESYNELSGQLEKTLFCAQNEEKNCWKKKIKLKC